MKFGIFGTGMVGKALGNKLVSLGHQVMLGSREAGNAEGMAWAKSAGGGAAQGSFTDAAEFGEIVFICLRGDIALPVVKSVGGDKLKGKIVIDVSNPLDLSKGAPFPLLGDLVNTTSLGEEVQKALPGAWVVKALNTVNCEVMVNPKLVNGESDLFICGNDAAAKRKVAEILSSFGWTRNPIDLGDITSARATEMLMPIWMRLFGLFGSPHFNFRIVR
ncbi:MAG: NAD(P)-binding domain-containing protein [Candidatus Acidiferrum sp.]